MWKLSLFKTEINLHEVELTRNVKMLKNPDSILSPPPTQFWENKIRKTKNKISVALSYYDEQ